MPLGPPRLDAALLEPPGLDSEHMDLGWILRSWCCSGLRSGLPGPPGLDSKLLGSPRMDGTVAVPGQIEGACLNKI